VCSVSISVARMTKGKAKKPSSSFSLKHYVLIIVAIFVLVQLWMTSHANKPSAGEGENNQQNPSAFDRPVGIKDENPKTIVEKPVRPTFVVPENQNLGASTEKEQTPPHVLIPPIEEEKEEDDDEYIKNSTLLSSLPLLSLPSVSSDESELILSSLIERTSDSWSLHLTTFFLARAMIDPNEIRANKVKSIRIPSIPTFEKLNRKQRQIYYLGNGRRALHKYECRIQGGGQEKFTYTVPGTFLPNRQTTDSNANRRLDIMRCPLRKPREAYLKYARSDDSVFMEILRNDEVIARIAIPWKTRRTGYLMTSPPTASRFDAWKGYQSKPNAHGIQTQRKPSSAASPGDNIYLCAADNRAFNPQSKALRILEFVQHHVMMKVDHMFISSGLTWSSKSMEILLTALARYVSAGQVSIVSEAGDNIPGVPSTAGLWWSFIPLINFHLNSCLFLSKGTAEYMGIWDLNEVFIPRLPYSNIVEVIKSANPSNGVPLRPSNVSNIDSPAAWKGGPGWADGDGHPYCYLALYSVEILQKTPESIPDSIEVFNGNPWASGRYGPPPQARPSDPSKSILPTKNIFQAGPHISGACQLDWEWTHCGQMKESSDPQSSSSSPKGTPSVCYVDASSSDYIDNQFNKNPPKFPASHDLDSVVFERDIKKMDMDTQGMLYQLSGLMAPQAPHKEGSVSGSDSANAYIHKFSTGVESVLQSYFTRDQLYSFYLPNEPPPETGDWVSYPTAFPPLLQDSQSSASGSGSPLVDIKVGSRNGYLDFQEPFTSPDILEDPPMDYLPTFASDYSDILLSSLIERKHSSWDLHLTSFFVSHSLVNEPPKGYGMRRLSPINSRKWKFIFQKFHKTKYLNGGIRDNGFYKMGCRITNGPGQQPYEVSGVFMPNSLTPDGNANRRVDIFRCKIRNSKWCYQNLANTNHSISVEIFRGDTNNSIFQFTVPWKTRRKGFLLDSPEGVSSFDPWKSFDPTDLDPQTKPGDRGGDELYMAVPGIESPISQKNLPMYAEFMQHHYLLGVQHMFWAVTYAWNGLNMANFLTAFRPFIDEKLLTVNSQAGDNFDLLYSFLGASLDRDNVKIMHVNMILYLTKGVVDYLAIWDIDEYFIPRLPYNNILEVIHAAESPVPLKPYPPETSLLELSHHFKGGRGWADGDAHPFCYLMIFSEVVYASQSDYDPDKPWVGDRLRHLPEKSGLAFKKSIIPTRRIWQVGLHMHGACGLEPAFRGSNCDETEEFCYCKNDFERRGLYQSPDSNVIIPFANYQQLDASVYDRDAKALNIQTEATIYHFQIHRPHLTASVEALEGKGGNQSLNEYVLRFYPRVRQELERRNFDLIVRLPDVSHHLDKQAAEASWLPLGEFYAKVIDHPDAANIRSSLPINPSKSEYHEFGCELPSFGKDFTELVFGAIIERDADSLSLHLTTFLISREQLANKSKRIKNHAVRSDSMGAWAKAIHHAVQTSEIYTEYGTRKDGHVYHCRMANRHGSEIYTVKGIFIPNQLTPDANANRRLDILRCPIAEPLFAYQHLANSEEHLYVQILRDHTDSLIKFKVPWKTRKTGYMLTTPPGIVASNLDLWKGSKAPPSSSGSSSSSSAMDELHMCVPGIESSLSKATLAIYAEFFQHHYLLGVNHIHAAVTYTWSGSNMKLFLSLFKRYIDSGQMSVTSTAGDVDGMYGLFGMNMERDNVKVFNVNLCLYLAKGVADYVAIWDIDEYFIPKPPHVSIMDVIRYAESPFPLTPLSLPSGSSASASGTGTASLDPFKVFPNWKGGRGWADLDGHPFCYLMMSSEALYRVATRSEKPSLDHPWIGDRFILAPEVKSSLKFKKPIIPTRRIFQAALHMVGGCKLDFPWNGCPAPAPPSSPGQHNSTTADGFCYVELPRQRYGLSINHTNNAILDFSFEQRFDGLILDKDAKQISSESQAVIYHFQVHRGFHTSSSPPNSSNEYVKSWFPQVRKGLQKSGYEIFMKLPAHVPFSQKRDEVCQWPEISQVYQKVIAQMI
jgi:hypothetical protein